LSLALQAVLATLQRAEAAKMVAAHEWVGIKAQSAKE
jgi:hypothetical protein